MKDSQLNLFGEQDFAPARRPRGGSNSPMVFHDYDSFIAKFQNK